MPSARSVDPAGFEEAAPVGLWGYSGGARPICPKNQQISNLTILLYYENAWSPFGEHDRSGLAGGSCGGCAEFEQEADRLGG